MGGVGGAHDHLAGAGSNSPLPHTPCGGRGGEGGRRRWARAWCGGGVGRLPRFPWVLGGGGRGWGAPAVRSVMGPERDRFLRLPGAGGEGAGGRGPRRTQLNAFRNVPIHRQPPTSPRVFWGRWAR